MESEHLHDSKKSTEADTTNGSVQETTKNETAPTATIVAEGPRPALIDGGITAWTQVLVGFLLMFSSW
jgi:hypothetical protein